MRLILNLRGTNVIDLEMHWPRRADQTDDDRPTIEATSGGSYERADQYGDPATQMGFGFMAGGNQ